jgi:hypothetical protein
MCGASCASALKAETRVRSYKKNHPRPTPGFSFPVPSYIIPVPADKKSLAKPGSDPRPKPRLV